MTTKPKKQAAKPTAPPKGKPIGLPKENRNVLPIAETDEEGMRKRLAEVYLLPNFNAARLALAYNPDRSLDLIGCGSTNAGTGQGG